MNVLITSPRAPAVIEWIHMVAAGNHTIVVCDSVRFPVCRFVKARNLSFRRLPSPRMNTDKYHRVISQLIDEADLVIPTCEDIFHLTQLPLTKSQRAKCFMPEKGLLMKLHHKIDVFSALPKTSGIRFPESRIVMGYDDIVDDRISGIKTVMKPVFSRFGRHVIRGVTNSNTHNISISPNYPWVQQEFIEGEPVCNFAIFQHGALVSHVAYRPRYLLNDSAASYFEPLDDDVILSQLNDFIHAFGAQHNFHGQVAFDFIYDGERSWVLECNPRTTSGLHLMGNTVKLNTSGDFVVTGEADNDSNPRFVGASMHMMFAFKAFKERRFKQFIADCRCAHNVLSDIPWYVSCLSFAEFFVLSVKYRKPLTDIATYDIEYDG